MFGRARLSGREATGIAVRLEGESAFRFIELPRPRAAAPDDPVWLTVEDADFTPLSNPLDERVVRADGLHARLFLLDPPREEEEG